MLMGPIFKAPLRRRRRARGNVGLATGAAVVAVYRVICIGVGAVPATASPVSVSIRGSVHMIRSRTLLSYLFAVVNVSGVRRPTGLASALQIAVAVRTPVPAIIIGEAASFAHTCAQRLRETHEAFRRLLGVSPKLRAKTSLG